MASKFSFLSLCAIMATAPLASCQSMDWSRFTEWSISGDGETGLWGIPVEEYINKDDANATGTINLDGYNLTIAVTADVPMVNSTNTTMTTVISLGMDQALVNGTTCVAIWHGLSANISAAANGLDSQDGHDCGSILTDECVRDFEFAVSEALTEDCSGSMPDIPDSCRDQFDNLNGSEFPIQSEDEQVIYQYGTGLAAPGNETRWLAAATNVWPIFVSPIIDEDSGSAWSAVTTLSCLRPDTFKEGTVRPSAEPNGTESGGGGSTGTGTTTGATASPTNAASQAGLTTAAAVVGLLFNMAMLFR